MELCSCSFCCPAFSSFLTPLFFIGDVITDLLTIVSFYQEEKYVAMGLFIFLLLISSVILQIFSWLWYNRTNPPAYESKIEKFIIKHSLLGLMHIFQLGLFLRILADAEIKVSSCKKKTPHEEGKKDSISDLIKLRLFEAFTESAPQAVLMMALTMQMQELHLYPVVKMVVSLGCMALSMLSYHRSMREYIANKLAIKWYSVPTIIYFLWNLFLIVPRMVSMSLFASVLPCYIAVHFLSLWTLLVLWGWWQKINCIDSKGAEWLYRATIAIIWYFNWYNVTSSDVNLRQILYHTVMGVDIMLLYGLWWWRRTVESARLSPLPINIYLLIALLMIMYILGVALKQLYFWNFKPSKENLQLNKKQEENHITLEYCIVNDETTEICTTILTTPSDTQDHESDRQSYYEDETEASETQDRESDRQSDCEDRSQ